MSRDKPEAAAPRVEQTLYDVIRLVRPLHRYMAKVVEDSLEGSGITLGMRAVMERLFEQGPQTVPQIARALLLPRQVVQRVVDAGLEAGQLARRPNPAHRRSVLIELGARGRAAIERIKAREERHLREVAEGLERRDVEACLRVMRHLEARFRPASGTGKDVDTD